MANTYNWGAMRNDMVQSPLAIDDTMMATPSAAFGSGLSFDKPNKDDNPNLDVSNVDKQRKTFSPLAIMGSLFIDALGESAGVEGAKMGGTMERMAQARKLRAESDPEGTQADLNRAKLLSRRAAETDDPAKKAEYGAAIKKLFPMETQGLDDITASYLYMADNDKLQLEMLKGENALRKQMLINQGRIENTGLANEGKRDVANINALSREQVTTLNNDTRREVALLQAEARKAIAEGNNARALEIAGIVDQRMRDLAIVNGEYRLQNTGLANQGRMDVAGLNATAAMDRLLTKGAQDMRLQAAKYASQLEIERLRGENRLNVANIAAATRERVAKMGIKEAGPALLQNGQELVPSQGVIDALADIEANPSAYDARAALLDTKLGRAVGVISEKSSNRRANTQIMLNQLVQDSAQSLMAIFPKGGSGVINSGVEQKLFIPIADIIANGSGAQIIGAVKGYYGRLYDAAASYGERPPITRQEYIDYMTKGIKPKGLNKVVPPTQSTPTAAPATEPSSQQSVGNKYKDSGLFV